MRRLRYNWVSIILILFVLLSCTVKLRVPLPDTLSEAQLTACARRLQKQYPLAFNLTQHLTVNVRGKAYDFVGYLQKQANGDYSAVAAGEMGGTFVALQKTGSEISIVRNPMKLPENPLRKGVASDIVFLYVSFICTGKLSGGYEQEMLQLFCADSLNLRHYQFRQDTLVSATQWREDKLMRTARFSNYRKFPGWQSALPAVIELENKRWRYKLRIELLEIESSEN